MAHSQSDPLQVDQLLVILDKVTKRLNDHKGGSGTKFPMTMNILEEDDIRGLFTNLRDVLTSIVSDNISSQSKVTALELESLESKTQVSQMSDRVNSLEKASRIQADLADHHHQRSLKGKFTISPLQAGGLSQREDLVERGELIESYVCSLILKKFNFVAHEKDILSCHFSKNGLIFCLSTLAPNSIYGSIVKAIKTGHGREIKDILFNFALTPKRGALLYELRQAKKGNIIEKLYSDCDGTVSYVSLSAKINSRGKKEKTRVTSIFDKVDSGGISIRTFSVAELKVDLGNPPNLDSSSLSNM